MKKTLIALLALISIVVPASAFHRQTPSIVPITIGGDTPIPRLAAGLERMAVAIAPGPQIFLCHHSRTSGIELQQITTTGSNANPTLAPRGGTIIAWDGDCDQSCDYPGRQIFEWVNREVIQVSHDPSGTSANPTLSAQGNMLAWESTGDLVPMIQNGGVQQIFLRGPDGTVSQVSRGHGTSRNASIDRSGRNLVYESSNDYNGNDTGIPQIWLLQIDGSHLPITNGASASRRPMISSVARMVVFESTAALTTDGHDTNVSQIFLYDARAGTFTQISNDPGPGPGGCSGASISRTASDWRIGYVCRGQGFFHTLAAGKTFRLPIPGNGSEQDTQQATVGFGIHFMTASTKADLMTGSGTTTGHQIYLLNLYKRPPEPVN